MTHRSRRDRSLIWIPPRAVKWVQLSLGAFAALIVSVLPLLPAQWPLSLSSPPAIAQAFATEANVAMATGRDRYRSGQYAAAADAWQAAITILEQSGDRASLASAWTYAALARQQLGDLDTALDATDTALAIAETLDSEARSPLLARAANARGSILLKRGQPETALSAWQQATDAYAAVDDDAGRIGSTINQSQAMQALGLYRQARQTLVGLDADLERLPDSSLRCLGLLNLGNVLRLSGDLDEARRVLARSLALAESADADDRSRILTSLGNVERASRNPEAAREYYQQAIAIAIAPATRVRAQLDRLDLALASSTESGLDPLWRDIRSQLDALPRSRDAADARIHWLSAMTQLRSAGRVDLAWSELADVGAEAVVIARDLRDTRAESHAVGTLGALYERAGQLDDARALTERALTLAQSTAAADIAYQWQ
ncbi:MAG: tetratricopeptide repeat protein, partial [Cyanobacteria bacterium J06648_11]